MLRFARGWFGRDVKHKYDSSRANVPVRSWYVSSRSALCTMAALLASATYLRLDVPWCAWCLARNALWTDGGLVPDVPLPLWTDAPCTDHDLSENVAVLVSLKDTCSQGSSVLASLRDSVPRSTFVVYTLPNDEDCSETINEKTLRGMYPNSKLVHIDARSAPFDGFLAAKKELVASGRKHVLLMHSDVFPMDGRQTVCSLHRALERTSEHEVPFAAPHLYERGTDGIVVPHAHHGTLRRQRTHDGECALAYDVDGKGLLRRMASDFEPGWQPDFLEDHAFMGRTSNYDAFLDPHASFTLEYLDVALNLKSKNGTVAYVPSSRFLFDVSAERLSWRDLPYLVWKRSRDPFRDVSEYMTQKWGCHVPTSAIWAYVKHTSLAGVDLRGTGQLPSDHASQARLVEAWFKAAGMEDVQRDRGASVLNKAISSTTSLSCAYASSLRGLYVQENVHEVGRTPHPVVTSLPETTARTWMQMLGGPAPQLSSVAELNSCSADVCHLMYVDARGECRCFVRRDSFDSSFHDWMRSVLGTVRLSPRAWSYVQMAMPYRRERDEDKAWTRSELVKSVVECNVTQIGERACGVCQLDFGPGSILLAWRWPSDGRVKGIVQ